MTVALDEGTTRRFDAERRELFPPGRTRVGAHLTLFHAVPGAWLRRVVEDLSVAAPSEPVRIRVDEVVSLGRGAAYRCTCAAVDRLHARLQRDWWAGLTRQDRQPLRAHVTVQNKVAPDVARATLARLRAGFAPFTADAVGLAVWRYAGGPWEHAATVPLPAPDCSGMADVREGS